MNISKAKTVLIAVFLGLNIFLIYHLFLPEWGGARDAFTRDEFRRMENKLTENNYEVCISIPEEMMSSSFLTVRPLKADAEKIRKQFFKAERVNRIISDDKITFEGDGETCLLYTSRCV